MGGQAGEAAGELRAAADPGSDFSAAARQGFWAVAAQAAVSLARFRFFLQLGRRVGREELGAYAVGLALLLLVTGIQAALVTWPLLVLGPGRSPEEFRRQARAALLFQGVLGLAATLVAVGVGLVLRNGRPILAEACFGAGSALFFFQGQEFCRQLLLAAGRARRVLLNDLVLGLLQVGGLSLFLARRADRGTSGGEVFLVLAAACAAAFLLGLFQARDLLARVPRGWLGVLREHLRPGRWVLGANIGNHLLMQGNNLILASVGGEAAAAALEGSRQLVAPLHILTIGGFNALLPRAAARYARAGRESLPGFLKPVWIASLSLYGGFCLAVGLAARPLLHLLFNGRLDDAAPLVWLWGGAFLLQGVRLPSRLVVNVSQRMDLAMWGHLAGAVALLALSLGLSPAWGAAGAAWSRLAADGLVTALTLRWALGLLAGRLAPDRAPPGPAEAPP